MRGLGPLGAVEPNKKNYPKRLDRFSSEFFELKQRRNLHNSTSGNEWLLSLIELKNKYPFCGLLYLQ
jgi:hypothetical protein